MRFVSQHVGYGAQIRPQRQRSLGDGAVEVLTPGLYVKFRPVIEGAMLYENERRAALDHFNFRGNTQDIGEAVPTDPVSRLSVFDTDEEVRREGWTPEEKKLVEARLVEIAQTTPTEVLLVADKPIAAPFPNYDFYEGDPVQLVTKLIEDGHDLDLVLHYERVFGPNRPEIIDVLEGAITIRDEEIVTA